MVLDERPRRTRSAFLLKLTDRERAELEKYVAARNAELRLGRVTTSDVVRAAIADYIQRDEGGTSGAQAAHALAV